jgi:DNA polymerase III subunit epsilon
VLKRASMPPNIPQGLLASLPQVPGVYIFLGEAAHHLYVGKAKNIRERVGSHFTNDFASDKELELSYAVRDIRFERTAGEFSAHLREIQLIQSLLPSHNIALRKKIRPVSIVWDVKNNRPHITTLEKTPEAALTGYGVYTSRSKARETLEWLVRSHQLCALTLGLERSAKLAAALQNPADFALTSPNRFQPCFGYQLGRCHGACVGKESMKAHQERAQTALEAMRLKVWPYDGPLAVTELLDDFSDPSTKPPHVHWFDQWRYMGSSHSEDSTDWSTQPKQELPTFNLEIYRLLVRTLEKRPQALSFTEHTEVVEPMRI